jgi:hypothetical protein
VLRTRARAWTGRPFVLERGRSSWPLAGLKRGGERGAGGERGRERRERERESDRDNDDRRRWEEVRACATGLVVSERE